MLWEKVAFEGRGGKAIEERRYIIGEGLRRGSKKVSLQKLHNLTSKELFELKQGYLLLESVILVSFKPGDEV